eukprot:328251-Pelagomonas_calceolata.AAC.12
MAGRLLNTQPAARAHKRSSPPAAAFFGGGTFQQQNSAAVALWLGGWDTYSGIRQCRAVAARWRPTVAAGWRSGRLSQRTRAE